MRSLLLLVVALVALTVCASPVLAEAEHQEGHASKEAGKIERTFELPIAMRGNTPEAIERALKPAVAEGLLPVFPFGSDFTEIERRLLPALQLLKSASAPDLMKLALRGLSPRRGNRDCLDRLGLAQPRTPSEWLYRALVDGALEATQ